MIYGERESNEGDQVGVAYAYPVLKRRYHHDEMHAKLESDRDHLIAHMPVVCLHFQFTYLIKEKDIQHTRALILINATVLPVRN